MANPQTPAGASNPAPPPVLNLPWGTVKANGDVYLNISALEFLQTLWASVQGGGGVIDTINVTRSSSSKIEALVLGLIGAIAEPTRFKAPAPNLAAARQSGDDAAKLARRPHTTPAALDTGMLARRRHLMPGAPDTTILARRPRILPIATTPNPTFAQLPANPKGGDRNFITDGSVVAAGNFGTTAAGGGTNHVPVYYDDGAATWRIG